MYDILDDVAPDSILDNLESLINDFKDKNSDMKTYVCQIVPTSMSHVTNTKIEDYNEHLLKQTVWQ